MQLKTYAFLFVFMMILSFNSHGQDNASTYQKSQMAMDLELDEGTATQFDSINRSYKAEINELKIKSSSKKNLKKLTALEEKRDEELQTILTKEQFDNYVALRRKQRENMRSLIRKKQ